MLSLRLKETSLKKKETVRSRCTYVYLDLLLCHVHHRPGQQEQCLQKCEVTLGAHSATTDTISICD